MTSSSYVGQTSIEEREWPHLANYDTSSFLLSPSLSSLNNDLEIYKKKAHPKLRGEETWLGPSVCDALLKREVRCVRRNKEWRRVAFLEWFDIFSPQVGCAITNHLQNWASNSLSNGLFRLRNTKPQRRPHCSQHYNYYHFSAPHRVSDKHTAGPATATTTILFTSIHTNFPDGYVRGK